MKDTTKHLYMASIIVLLTANLYFQYEQTSRLKDIRSTIYSTSSGYDLLDAIRGIRRDLPSESTQYEILNTLRTYIERR